jgi:flagellar basal-body rod modification protein FlgD
MVDSSSAVTGATSSSSTTTAAKTDELGKDQFFKMLIAQLKYQDPLNPMDGADFSAQLAQFTSLEQLSNISETLDAQSANYSQLVNLEAVGMIGKEVEASYVDPETAQQSTVTGTVSSVQFKDNSIYLTVDDKEIAFGDLISVK